MGRTKEEVDWEGCCRLASALAAANGCPRSRLAAVAASLSSLSSFDAIKVPSRGPATEKKIWTGRRGSVREQASQPASLGNGEGGGGVRGCAGDQRPPCCTRRDATHGQGHRALRFAISTARRRERKGDRFAMRVGAGRRRGSGLVRCTPRRYHRAWGTLGHTVWVRQNRREAWRRGGCRLRGGGAK